MSLPPIEKPTRQRFHTANGFGSRYTQQHSWGSLHRRGRGRGHSRGFRGAANRGHRRDVTSIYLDRGLSLSNPYDILQQEDIESIESGTL